MLTLFVVKSGILSDLKIVREIPVALAERITIDRDIPHCLVAPRDPIGLHESDQIGVAAGVQRAGNIHFFEQPFFPEIAIQPLAPQLRIPGRMADSTFASDEQVVFNQVVVSAMDKDCAKIPACGPDEDISKNFLAAGSIIEINSAAPVAEFAADIMPVIVTDHISALGWISPHIEGSTVVSFHPGVMDFIQFDDVVIAKKPDSLVRAIVQEVIPGHNTHSTDMQMKGMSSLALGDIPDVVIDGLVPAGDQLLAIPALEGNP